MLILREQSSAIMPPPFPLAMVLLSVSSPNHPQMFKEYVYSLYMHFLPMQFCKFLFKQYILYYFSPGGEGEQKANKTKSTKKQNQTRKQLNVLLIDAKGEADGTLEDRIPKKGLDSRLCPGSEHRPAACLTCSPDGPCCRTCVRSRSSI